MSRALSLARRALGSVSPNPSVGAVLVQGEEVVGEGWTQPPGQEHAEVMAIRIAGPRAAGATMYCTLEPCDHIGRTGPCTDAIIEAGIAEVHVSMLDPNPMVCGKGLSSLNDAGVKTYAGEGRDEAGELTEAYATYVTTGLPHVTAKFAMSLDGKIATRTGDSRWITGEEARRFTHELRATSDCIMTGVNTVLADDPQLTARDEDGVALDRQPLRVVVDSAGGTPPRARLLSEPGRTLVAIAHADDAVRRALTQAGAEIEAVPADDGAVDLLKLLKVLGEREITSVFVESGGTLLGSLFDRDLVDKVVAFVAPTIIGGKMAPSPVGGDGHEKMADALRLRRVRVRNFGDDVALIGYCKAESDVHWNR